MRGAGRGGRVSAIVYFSTELGGLYRAIRTYKVLLSVAMLA